MIYHGIREIKQKKNLKIDYKADGNIYIGAEIMGDEYPTFLLENVVWRDSYPKEGQRLSDR